MIQKIEVLAADVDMTLSSKVRPLPEITIHALKELHYKNVKIKKKKKKKKPKKIK